MKNKKGFTIVELVIVIAVIAILAGVLIPTFSGVIQKANESAALQEATSTMKATLAMSKTAEIADHTLFAIGDASKTNYMYEYANNAISEESKVNTVSIVNGGSVVPSNEGTKYDRIIINNSLITNAPDWGTDATKVQAIIKTTVSGAVTLTLQQKGTQRDSSDKVLMTDTAASYELVVKDVDSAVIAVLAVYISSDYAKDVVTFVPATIGY